MAAASALGNFLLRIEEQHRELLQEVSSGSFRLITEENHRLTDQLSHQSLANVEKLKQVKKVSPQQPGVPPLPPRLFTPPVMQVNKPRMPGMAQVSRALTPLGGKNSDKANNRDSLQRIQEPKAWQQTKAKDSMYSTKDSIYSMQSLPGTVHDTWELPEKDNSVFGASKRTSQEAWNPQPRMAVGGPKVSVIGSNFFSPVTNTQQTRKDQRRLKNLLGLSQKEENGYVTADRLFRQMETKRPECNLSIRDAQEIIKEMCKIQQKNDISPLGDDDSSQIAFDAFMQVLSLPTVLTDVHPGLREQVEALMKALQRTTIEEVIQEATRGTEGKATVVAKVEKKTPWIEMPLNILVMTMVIINLISMGVSVDYWPESDVWLILEAVCSSVFVTEVVYKFVQYGICDYFRGENKAWNILDFAITAMSVMEVSMSLLTKFSPDDGSGGGGGVAANITPMLRILRATRVVRLVKLLRFKAMRELASMLVGIVIGIPALFWVFLLFVLVLFVLGTCFRVMFGPVTGQSQIDMCGLPDDYNYKLDDESECRLHWMYGEEYFGTVRKSMFTTFRFMIGDFSTAAGKSLAVEFSRGYGDVWDLMFTIGMISVMFGLFNVITAIFVDSTISGLQHSDLKKKHSRQYESKFVKDKLQDLLNHIGMMRDLKIRELGIATDSLPDTFPMKGKDGKAVPAANKKGQKAYVIQAETVENLELNEDEFLEVIDDETTKRILEDLDVKISNPASMYDTFDPDGNGSITCSDFVEAVMKLRGEPQKNDLIASWQALRALHEKVDEMMTHMDINEEQKKAQVKELSESKTEFFHKEAEFPRVTEQRHSQLSQLEAEDC